MNAPQTNAYRVLARRYRPQSFPDLIGQEALVQTLSNALALGRLAHAFVLTGVRGVGKTSTARIIAKGLNCIGADGTGGPTLEPCGQCEPCQQISQGRHVDVLEMDAASHTGVDDVRDIIDGAAYRPVSTRFKIYIIDEVHMLSKSAFNALLKTLEEPPDSVKFIFATTEIRKVPVTILSRCQRFDLRRVPTDMLAQHLDQICEKENIGAEAAALRLIAQAAEGSVRDSLSLLDQAAAMSEDKLTEADVVQMLGQADMAGLAGLLLQLLQGEVKEALAALSAQDRAGAEPLRMLGDMLTLTHQASLKAAGAEVSDVPDAVGAHLDSLSALGIARLGRAWQILLAGNQECQQAPNPTAALQMLLIRLAHAAPMPTPAEILAKLPEAPAAQKKTLIPDHKAAETETAPLPTPPSVMDSAPAAPASAPEPTPEPVLDTAPDPTPDPAQDPVTPTLTGLADIVALAEEKLEPRLAAEIRLHVRLGQITDGALEIALTDNAPDNLPARIAKALSGWTGKVWMVSLTQHASGQTLAETERQAHADRRAEMAEREDVKQVLQTFKGSFISDIRTVTPHPSSEADDAREDG